MTKLTLFRFSDLAHAGSFDRGRRTKAWTAWTIGAVLAILLNCLPLTAQSPEWAWAGGATTIHHAPVYGTRGASSANASPGSRYGANSWTDSSGSLWLFGGLGIDSNGTQANQNDLWEYSPATSEWTWVIGGNGSSAKGNFGQVGVASTANFPSVRDFAASWTDKSGNFWLFGGQGEDSAGNFGPLNDLWEYSPSTGEWAWMGGPSTLTCVTEDGDTNCGNAGVYGTQTTPSKNNIPGSRSDASTWVDGSGNLWLFGGAGYGTINGANSGGGQLNDLWEYSPPNGTWTWVSGSTSTYVNSVYGTVGVPGGKVGTRAGAASWIDKSGDLWLFGGTLAEAGEGDIDDLWEFNPGPATWTWWGGDNSSYEINIPGARENATGWTDSSGNLWLFGGTFPSAAYCGASCDVAYQDYDYDLWQYNPSSNTWTQVSGSNSLVCTVDTANCSYIPGSYGTFGHPGGRSGMASWTDALGRFWIYGGDGVDSNGKAGLLSDLWLSGPPAPTPVFSLKAGTYTGIQSVSISDAAAGAKIYYTTDGTKPTSSSALYTTPVVLNRSLETLQAVAVAPEFGPSLVASSNFSLALPVSVKPEISPAPGVYKGRIKVTITSSMPDSTIYYALNSTPTISSTPYTGPITISRTETVEAVALAPGYAVSPVAKATFTIANSFSTLTVAGHDPYAMTCSVSGPALTEVEGLTGTVTFTDKTTGDTLATATLGASTIADTFQPPTAYPAGKLPTSSAVGDFNNDGIPDIAVADGDGTVTILFGNGDGTFRPQTPFAVGTYLNGIVEGKFAENGDLGLAVADMSGQVWSLAGNGKGSFTATEVGNEEGGTSNFGIVAADFNGDGKLDLAVTNSGGHDVQILLGNGDGTFSLGNPVPVESGPRAIVTGRFSGAKKPVDLVVANFGSGTVSILIGNGDGTFKPQVVISESEVGSEPAALATADFNKDGNLDFAVLSFQRATVFLGNGDGTFQYSPALQVSQPNFGEGFAAGDFNGDGIPDLAVAAGTGSTFVLQIFTGVGNGTFEKQNSYPVGNYPLGVLAADLTGTGNASLVTANWQAASVSVLINYRAASATVSRARVVVNAGTIASHDLECSYSGDEHYQPSISAPITVTFSAAPAPVFSLLAGIYPAQQMVTITDTIPNSPIYYTTNGSDPTKRSTRYTGPFTVTSLVKLKAIAVPVGYTRSTIAEAVYNIADPPQFSAVGSAKPPASRNAENPSAKSLTVTITDKTPGAVIYYATDNTRPSTKSTRYTGPIKLLKATVIKAFAIAPGYIDSVVSTHEYNP
ncbi:MAG: chitobiase/beta-hexosaminidase C-terminal domain-containing protein [Terracidiphilus sp.]